MGECHDDETSSAALPADGEPRLLQRTPATATATEKGRAQRLASPRFAGEPRLEACLQDRARLTIGARDDGEHTPVRKVQQALLDLNFDLGPAGADGKFGSRTSQAVKAFKGAEKLGFEHIGDVGPGTMRRLDELFAAQPPPPPTCADAPVDETIDPLPAVPPFTFRLASQQDLVEMAKRQGQAVDGVPLGASEPSFTKTPFQDSGELTFPVSVTAIPDDGCFRCAASWQLPVAWRTLIVAGAIVLPEPKRFFVSRPGDVSGCPPAVRLLDVRELVTPDVLPFVVAAELEHYLDFVRAFRIVGGRYLANVARLSPERTHLRARDAKECERKVRGFLVLSHGLPFRPPRASASSSPVVELDALKSYTEDFINDFIAFYLSPDRDRKPDGPHIAHPQPPTSKGPIHPNIDRDVNPFGCGAYCRKLTPKSFPGIPGGPSEALVKDDNTPRKQPWHAL